MTISQLLENQNMASACKVTYTYKTQPGRQELNSTGMPVAVGSTVVDTYEEVCYQPIIGYSFILSIPILFMITVLLLNKFLSK